MATLDLLAEIDQSLNVECHTIPMPEECGKILHKYRFKVLHANIRSVQRNFDSFLVVFQRLNIPFDAIVFSECWINELSIIKQIEGYKCYNSTKFINKSGGVIIYLNNKWSGNVTEPEIDDANSLMVEVPNAFTLVALYRSPSFTNPDRFISSLGKIISPINRNSCTIVLGDTNINILADDDNSSAYLDTFAASNLISSINSPTHCLSCIDHLFVPTTTRAEAVICPVDLTDHSLIMAGFSVNNYRTNPLKRSRLKIDFEGLSLAAKQIDWSDIINRPSLEDVVSNFSSHLSDLVSNNSRFVQVSHKKFCIKPWMTPGLIRCSKHKDKLHSEAKKYPNDEPKKIVYTRYRNFYISLLRKLKADYERNELNNSRNIPRKLWNCINRISHRPLKKNCDSPQDLLKVKNNVKDSLDECNKYFTSVGQDLANSILKKLNESHESLTAKVKMRTPPSPLNSFFISPTDESELKNLINSLKTDSSPGLDNISNKIIKSVAHIISEPLAAIFNKSIETGVFPSSWKNAAVIPIYKDGSRDSPSNYRPISLLGCIPKLLEKIINKRLVSYIESNGMLSSRQFGFRQGKGTEDAVTLLTNIISTSLDSGQCCIGVFLDLSKAFDSISVPILLKKLESYGIRGNVLQWFTSYLTDRQQCVRIGEHTSDFRAISFGVPQGSILGPTLFLLYMNDITSLQLQNADILCYADDTVLIFHDKSWQSVHRRAEDGMMIVADWLNSNLLSLNTKKTKFLCFHKTSATAPHTIQAMKLHSTCRRSLSQDNICNCDSVERSGTIRYLGVILDDKLTFKDHIAAMSKRVRKIIYVMRNLRDVIDGQTLKSVYMALCQSVLGYCIRAWGGAASSILISLERAQRAVLKVALRKPIRYPTCALFSEAGVLSVRRLFYLRVAINTHTLVLNSNFYTEMLNKRIFRLPHATVKTSFAQRFGGFLFPYIYNKLMKLCDFKYCTTHEAKALLSRTLLHWDYDESESFIRIKR